MPYSASRLETYRQCPQKFKFTYVDGIKTASEGIEAFMGSRVHETLETLYTDLKFCKTVTLESLLDFYHRSWAKAWHDDVKIVREDLTPDNYEALGEKCVVDYYNHYTPFDQGRTLGIEHRVNFDLDPEGQYSILGFIDRISQPKDKVIWIHDYKAKSHLPSQQDLDEDRQLAFYQMAIKQLWPDIEEVELVWHYVMFDQEIHSRRSDAQLEELRQETITLIQEIESATDFPSKKSGLCNWCEHQSICPQFKHLFETKDLPPNEYMGEPGVQLGERLVYLQAEEEKIKKELKQVKEALTDYTKKKGVETVFTKDHKILVKFYSNIKFPGRKDPGRQNLEKLIRDAGLWDVSSSLDVYALARLIDKSGWDVEVVEKIKKFGTPDQTPWIKAFPKNQRRGW
ncbi:hypothetical protein MNBD_NITROSPIRAE01-2083 [hydrothermal vent metagenome]|uniref:PD-(D/E)XK endonuclease-like domain-containing protein n=1 Tax=hydrothermal vent metagenome TaxID=652676 RepID=A0A3B1CHM1_9ZZZZ